MARSWWGWGWEHQALPDAECARLAQTLWGRAAIPVAPPRIADLDLRAPRTTAPPALADRCSAEPRDRAAHTYGQAFRDVVRALSGDLPTPPDVVARPRDEQDVIDLLDWAQGIGAAVIPFGGGTSVVGGVEYRGDAHPYVVSLDLTSLNRVLEVDETSGAARIQAGILGPDLETQLRPHGLTLRHFPQSFDFSTLGGWLVTRAAGHFATVETHIDDLTESIRAVTPSGIIESWRLPGSGAGPSPDRMLLGSEGTLGVVTEAWMRVRPRPRRRASCAVRFDSVHNSLEAVRAIAQSGLRPANARWLDPGEAALGGAGNGNTSVLVLGFESSGIDVVEPLHQAIALVEDHGGRADGARVANDDDAMTSAAAADDAVGAWRASFLRMPYIRDGLARVGAIAETFETATTWDRVEELYETTRGRLLIAIEEVTGRPGLINGRLTHLYPDGAALYFTVLASAPPGGQLRCWDELKAAASEILAAHRATITHHHAVGRDHRPWYDHQRPALFASALRAVKLELDPKGILNPGVLVDAQAGPSSDSHRSQSLWRSCGESSETPSR